NGRLSKVTSQLQNGATNADEWSSRVTIYGYTPVGMPDNGGLEPNTPRSVTEKFTAYYAISQNFIALWLGHRVESRTPTDYAGWLDTGSLLTTNRSYAVANGSASSTTYPDGTVQISESRTNSAGTYKTNIFSLGQSGSNDTVIVDGTVTTTILGSLG